MFVIRDTNIAIRLARSECASLFSLVWMLQDRCPLRDDPVPEIEIDVIQYAPNRYPQETGKREKENDKGKEINIYRLHESRIR